MAHIQAAPLGAPTMGPTMGQGFDFASLITPITGLVGNLFGGKKSTPPPPPPFPWVTVISIAAGTVILISIISVKGRKKRY